MKPFLTLLAILLAFSALAQTTLPISRSRISYSAGQAFSGDSATIGYNSQLLSNLFYNFRLDNQGNWTQKSRSLDYTYDPDGNLLQNLFQTGNDVDGWVNSFRYIYTYNTDGNLLSDARDEWVNGNWVQDYAQYSVYDDATGLLQSQTSGNYRSLFTYNAENLLQIRTAQEWENGDWEDTERYEYTYVANESKLATESTLYPVNSNWLETTRYTYVYNVEGLRSETLLQQWNGTSLANASLTSSAYDANGNEVQQTVQNWNGTDWENSGRTTYTYDAAQNLTHWIYQIANGSDWENVVQQFNFYDAESIWHASQTDFWANGAWGLATFARFHYADFVAASSPESVGVEVFPNPATSFLVIRGEGLELANLFDANGRLLRTEHLNGQPERNLSLSQVPAGNYYLQIIAKDGQVATKAIQIR